MLFLYNIILFNLKEFINLSSLPYYGVVSLFIVKISLKNFFEQK